MSTIRHKYRLYPTQPQKSLLARTFGCVRSVYNHGLIRKRDAYNTDKTNISIAQLSKELTQTKQLPEFEYLKQVPATCLIQSLMDLDTAYKRFFKKESRYPRCKKKGTQKSARFQDVVVKNGVVHLPKLGAVKIKFTRNPPTEIKMATVMQDACGRYFISWAVEANDQLLPITRKIVGLDVGLTDLITCSNGEKFDNERFMKRKLKALKRSQRALARCQKQSNRRKKQRAKLARIHSTIKDSRTDYFHKITTKLVQENDIIAVEDLRIKNMMANHKLAGAIADCSWGKLVSMLEYKCNRYGRTFIKVNPHNTSKACHVCGTLHSEKMTLDIRDWTCNSCGSYHDRDINAARNILSRAWNQLVPGGTGEFTGDDPTCMELLDTNRIPGLDNNYLWELKRQIVSVFV